MMKNRSPFAKCCALLFAILSFAKISKCDDTTGPPLRRYNGTQGTNAMKHVLPNFSFQQSKSWAKLLIKSLLK